MPSVITISEGGSMLDLGMQVLKGLAVAGGAAIGWLGSGLLVRLLVRLSVQRTVPNKGLLLVRMLGGLAVGLAVWVWVSSPGGLGPGWGGWLGAGQSGGPAPVAKTESPPSSAPATPEEKPEPKPPTVDKAPPQPTGETVSIEILGGNRVQNERFYLLEGDKEPHTLPEVRKILQARRQDPEKPPLAGIVLLLYSSSVARDHPAVRNLVRWAEENRLSVTFPPTSGTAP